MSEELDFSEEKEIREGGEEAAPEEDPREKSAQEQREKDPDTLATPTELKGGGNSTGQGQHSGGPAGT